MSRLLPLLLCSLTLLSLLLPAQALYFHVTEGSRRCFLEEVPEDVLVLGRYTSLDHSKLAQRDADQPKAAIKITVTDPRQDVLLTHDTSAEGKFAFTSVVGGEHVICLSTNTSSSYGENRNFRMTLQLDIGENAQDYSEIAKQEHLSGQTGGGAAWSTTRMRQ